MTVQEAFNRGCRDADTDREPLWKERCGRFLPMVEDMGFEPDDWSDDAQAAYCDGFSSRM